MYEVEYILGADADLIVVSPLPSLRTLQVWDGLGLICCGTVTDHASVTY